MSQLSIIKAIKPTGEVNGEIKHVLKETRLMAMRGVDRLPKGTNITLLYMFLYDKDTRVRARAQDALTAVGSEDVEAFMETSGHHKVLDFLAHNFPKDSKTLETIANSSSLAKRTRTYLDSIKIVSSQKKEETSPAGKAGPQPSKSDEDSWTDGSLEWTPSNDIDLPDGVEFKMPTEDEAPHVMKAAATDVPESPSSDSVEETSAGQPEIEEEDVVSPEISTEPKAATPPEKIRSKKSISSEGLFPVYSPDSGEQAPPPEEYEYVEEEDAEKVEDVELEKKKAAPPVARRAKKAPEPEPPGKIKRELIRGLIIGLLMGIVFVAAFIAIDYFIPTWPEKIKTLKIWENKEPELEYPMFEPSDEGAMFDPYNSERFDRYV